MSARHITVRFFEVEDISEQKEALEKVLARLLTQPVEARAREVGGNLKLRLEHAQPDGDLWLGEITHEQTENLPAHVTKKGTEALAVPNLGHPVCFCFDKKAKAIAVQYNQNVRVGRVMQYFSMASGVGRYAHTPILSQASIEALGKKDIKSLEVTVSKVKLFDAAEPAKGDFEQAISAMGAAFEAPRIQVKVSTRSGTLKRSNVVTTVKKLLKINGETDTIRKIKAETFEVDEEPYNFLTQLLIDRDELLLLDNAPDANRQLRIAFMKTCYGKYQSYIRTYLDAE